MNPTHSFDNAKATRMIALGYPLDEILPEFEPLISLVIRRSVSFDTRNIDEDDLKQIARLRVKDVIREFNPHRSSLFVWASMIIRHTLWSACKLKPEDYARTPEEVDLDTHAAETPGADAVEPSTLRVPVEVMAAMRVSDPKAVKASHYLYGVLCSDLYEDNKARVLKTLTHGLGINPKLARYLIDQLLIQLRLLHAKSPAGAVREVRDDPFFYSKFKHSVIPELRELLGERAFELLVHYFGGLSITVPSHDHLDAIDRDLQILSALTTDWNSALSLSKKFGISPEGIKTVFKSNLHRMQTDEEYRDLVAGIVDLKAVPGFVDPKDPKPVKKKAIPDPGARRRLKRKMLNTDSMGFQLNSRNSLMYTLIVTGRCTRQDLVTTVHERFGGTLASAKSTVSAFLSDIKHDFGKFNTSRNLTILVDGDRRLSFEKRSLEAAQLEIARRRKANLEALG